MILLKPGLLLILFLSVLPAGANGFVVRDIRFEGNTMTRERVLMREIVIRKGKAADNWQVERSRQNIMNLGLFRQVTARRVNDVVVFKVVEKRFFVFYPNLSRGDDGNIDVGARMRWDNIAGRNYRFHFNYRKSAADEAVRGDDEQYEVNIGNPRLFGSFIQMDTRLVFEKNPVEKSGSLYLRDHYDLHLQFSRWLKQPGPSRGWLLGAGVRLMHRNYSLQSGVAGLYRNEEVVALTGRLLLSRVNNHGFSRSGYEAGIELETGARDIGSDFGYSRWVFFYRHYQRLSRPHENLNMQLRAGLSDGGVFGEVPFSIGGARTLRGYEGLDGEAYLIANIEYLRPLFGRPYLRGVLFMDIGNAWQRVDDIDLSDLKVGVGFGLRYKFKVFVKLDLRLDVAYNTETGETEVYAGTKQTF